MSDLSDLALVEKALKCKVTGCVEWHHKCAARVRGDRSLEGLSPEFIQEILVDHFANGDGKVVEVKETRPEYSHRDYWYKAIIPCSDFKHGLFVEMELFDDDQELPVVQLLNAHENRR